MFTDNPRQVTVPEAGATPDWGINLANPKHVSQLSDIANSKQLIAQVTPLPPCHCHGDKKHHRNIAQADGEPRQMQVVDYAVNDHQAIPGARKIIVIDLDLSGSMGVSGMPEILTETKLEVAEEALNKALAQIPDGTEVEIRGFGPDYLNPSRPGHPTDDCHQSGVLVKLQPLSQQVRETIAKSMKAWTVGGQTPTTYSMRQINDVDLKGVGKEVDVTEILITDGAESWEFCKEKLCDYYKYEWLKKFPERQLRLIGLNLTEADAVKMFACLERLGEKLGMPKHVDAYDVDSLTNGVLGSANVHGQVMIDGKPAKYSNPDNF